MVIRGRPQVRTAPIGSGAQPSTATLTYGSSDRGQDIPPLAIPPNYGTRPTPLSQAPGQAQPQPQSQPQYQAPVTAAPLPPAALAPVSQPAPNPAGAYAAGTSLPPFAPLSDQPRQAAPDLPRSRVLDTQASTQTRPLPPPRPTAQPAAGGVSPADALNAQQLTGAAYPSYQAPSYAAPSYPPQSYQPQPGYPQPGYPQAGYPTAAYPGYATPAPQQIQPQYAQPTGAYAQPVAPGGYAPSAQIPAELRYQPQVQGYLPQYTPAPPQSAAQRIAGDDAQFLRDSDFNKPFRPFLPRAVGADAEGPYGNSSQPAGPVGYYDNPFRRSPDAALAAAPSFRTAAIGGFATGTLGAATTGPDPVTQEIDRNIVQLRDTLAPSVQGGFGFRLRSGDAGLDKLTEITAPISTSFSPGGNGTIKLSATPVTLDAGTIGGDDSNLQRFGTYALHLIPPVTGGTTYIPAYLPTSFNKPSTQTAQGVGLSAAYTNQYASFDIGTTPVGFKIPNIVGGIDITPQLTSNVRLRVGIERRSLTDSVLSYAGTRDTLTGSTWGGVVRNRGKIGLDFTAGSGNFYVGGGGGSVTGRHVESNTEVDFGAGGSYPIFKQGDDEIRAGVDLVYLAYNKNLRFFTFGQGGYFSPQSYVSALIPFTYRTKIDEDLTYEVGAAIGLQTFSEKASNYYPSDPALQTQLNAITNFPGLTKVYPARSQSGFAGNLHGKLDYRVSPGLSLGAQISIQHSGSFDEAAGSVYAKYIFNGTQR